MSIHRSEQLSQPTNFKLARQASNGNAEKADIENTVTFDQPEPVTPCLHRVTPDSSTLDTVDLYETREAKYSSPSTTPSAQTGKRIIVGHEKSVTQAERRAEISVLEEKYEERSREKLMLIANGIENEATASIFCHAARHAAKLCKGSTAQAAMSREKWRPTEKK
uniref:Uncharacterized protein n=1 Tax=Glossina austeni TaxID=7395 RepID=A0A1A9VQD6_GLOAU